MGCQGKTVSGQKLGDKVAVEGCQRRQQHSSREGSGRRALCAPALRCAAMHTHLGAGGDLAEDHHHASLGGGLAGHLGERDRSQTAAAGGSVSQPRRLLSSEAPLTSAHAWTVCPGLAAKAGPRQRAFCRGKRRNAQHQLPCALAFPCTPPHVSGRAVKLDQMLRYQTHLGVGVLRQAGVQDGIGHLRSKSNAVAGARI